MSAPQPERRPTFFEKYQVLTVPNGITLLRFLALPVLGWYLCAGESGRIVSLGLFVVLAALDMVDGYVARHFNQISEFGKLFDPFVDKLFHFMTAALLCLTLRLPIWIPLFILVKEALMIVGGIFLLRRYKLVVYAKWYGKAATFLFAVAFAATILWVQPGQQRLAGFFFLIPILLSFVSYVQYGRENLIPTLRGTKNGSTDT
jgi:CDP-diacylglycerol--glycerol-3-phosphate 3-phosphatidyltransferase